MERDTREAGIEKHIRFKHKVISANWDSSTARWTVTAETEGRRVIVTAGFLMMCSGYYRYEAGYAPTFPGHALAGRDDQARIIPGDSPEPLHHDPPRH